MGRVLVRENRIKPPDSLKRFAATRAPVRSNILQTYAHLALRFLNSGMIRSRIPAQIGKRIGIIINTDSFIIVPFYLPDYTFDYANIFSPVWIQSTMGWDSTPKTTFKMMKQMQVKAYSFSCL